LKPSNTEIELVRYFGIYIPEHSVTSQNNLFFVVTALVTSYLTFKSSVCGKDLISVLDFMG